MAAIVEPSNGNAFWQQWFDRHAKAKTIYEGLRLVGRYVGRFLDFVFNGHILVSFVRWLVRVTGYTAESALMLAVLWITITSVAPMVVTPLLMDQSTMATSISFTVIVLAIIPELILINALTNVIEHWLRVIQGNAQSRTARVFSWIWAIGFTIPTSLFLYLTSVTIHNVQATGNLVQATTSMIDLRCYAGWAYAVLETLYATTRVGKRMMEGASAQVHIVTPAAQSQTPQPAIQIDYQEMARHLLPLVREEVETLIPAPIAAPVADGQINQLLEELATVKEMVSQVKGSVIQSDQIEQGFAQLTSQQSGGLVDEEVDNNRVIFPPQDDLLVDTEVDSEEAISPVGDDAKSVLLDDVLADVSMQSNTDQKPRITVKLQDDVVSTKRRVKSATKPSTTNDRGQARQKALRVLKRNPTLKPAELAEKAGISRQYASKIVSELSA